MWPELQAKIQQASQGLQEENNDELWMTFAEQTKENKHLELAIEKTALEAKMEEAKQKKGGAVIWAPACQRDKGVSKTTA